MSTSAREAILARIRTATADLNPAATPPVLTRNYQQTAALDREETLDLFVERLLDYDAEVLRVTPEQVIGAVQNVLAARATQTPVLLAPGFPAAWLPPQLSFIQDDLLPIRQLDHFDTVLTTATLGIAQTGTLVLVSGPGQGRRATTLVPDSHLCVLRARDIVETVPEAFARLISHNRSPITFVSGPSATADIEMTRIKGVHGPRFLHVILVQDVAPPLHAISRHTEAKDTRI